MEEKHNPNSHQPLRRQDTSSSWSDLPQDLLTLVFERLSITDFKRAKSVCSPWYSASRHHVPEKQITPWLILFPEGENQNYCMLFNPEEKDKLYITEDLGLDFSESVCMTTYGNWLLMQDRQDDLYIVNLFTQERINLPPIVSQLGWTTIRSPVFWIDEETQDYVVVWSLKEIYVVYAKKGDTWWNPIYTLSSCDDMVYKDHKLYFLSCSGYVTIFDFFGKIPEETVHCCNNRYSTFGDPWSLTRRKLVVTLTEDVLIVEKHSDRSDISSFHVYELYLSSSFKTFEQIVSLEDAAMLFDLGITVLAKDINGLKKNYIYYDGSNEKYTSEVQLFNLETDGMELLHEFDCSRVLSKARWFLPNF